VVELERFVRTRADARGDAGKIEMEVGFYERNYFMNALVLFLIGFVAVGLDWMRSTRILRLAAWGASLSGLALLVVGITVRCILLDRPPVATLYETILFIAAGGVATALFIEYAMRRRFFLGVACVLGALGMFLANRYEFQEAVLHGDTARPVVAVLDTNFWLATHVTTITLGYSASLLASVLSIAWLAGRMVEHVVARRGGGSPQANEAHKVRNQAFTDLTRAMYGVVCFGVVLSTVGTILGGIWANDSWGRFWGWDPKENGALLIVLWQLVMLHARLGGFVRQFGLHMLSLILGPVTVFSWWHINNLEIGLHSYGFTEGIEGIVMSYYYVIVAIAAVGLLWYALVGSDAANGRGSGPGGTPGGGASPEGAQGGDPNPAAS
jgi:ABC-type transport system involved in cytochrome c biogenesis permease subunit